MLFELSSSLFWSSIADILVFLLSFLLFCTDATHMGGVWIHIFHVARGGLGGFLVFKMPNTHDMLEEVTIPANEKVPLEKISDYAFRGAQKALKKFN